MKIVVINASPRKNGNTTSIINTMSDKWKSFNNVEIEHIYLSDFNIGLCKGCCNCLTVGEQSCPNKSDDIKIIEEKLLSSDGVVFASPVYAMNMTASMKNFMDRVAFTMHRPRFFNQYTMVLSVTGCIGLKETIESISQLKFSGFNIVQSFGIVAPNALINPGIEDTKIIKKIEKEAEKFYKKIQEKKPIKPSFMTVMQFKQARKTFAIHREQMPCDYQYFKSNNWFDKKKKYYVDNANISIGKKLLTDIFCSLF